MNAKTSLTGAESEVQLLRLALKVQSLTYD